MPSVSPRGAPPGRKRSQPEEQERERTIQQHTTPCVGVAPSKRRRSDAEGDAPVQDQDQGTDLGQDSGPNQEQDEKLDGAPQGELFVVTVRSREELQPCQDEKLQAEKLDALLAKEKAETETDVAWGHEFAALDSLRCFAMFHQDEARRQLENGVLKKLVMPAAMSLRSAMARNALLCVQDLILGLQTEIASHFDAIVPILLNRACSEKQFIRDLARDVLDTALEASADEALLEPLLSTSTMEKNAQIVNVAGLYVAKCIGRMDRTRLRLFILETRGSFFDEMAAFLRCKVVECKAATRRTCQHTRRIIGNETFVALAKEKLSGSTQLDVLKASEVRKAAKPGHAKSSIRERMLQLKKQQQQQKKAGNIHRDKRTARAKYLKSLDFFLDVLAIIPLSLILPPSMARCSQESNQTVLAQARINQLRHLLTFHHVPEPLQIQAVEYLKRHYTDAESNDREVVKLLCPSITKDIQVELLKDMVGRIPLFRGCNQQFIVALTSLLEMTSFPAHVTLFEAGDPGDYMYVVNSGVLHILVNGVKVRELRQGSFFGEVSVFSKRPRSAAVVTTSYCTLYRLSRFHTERVLEGYPNYASQIASTIDEMVNEQEGKVSEGREVRDGGEEFMLTTLTSSRPDTMQGFYDNLARRRVSHQQATDALSKALSNLLMRRAIDFSSQWRKYWLIALQVHLVANCAQSRFTASAFEQKEFLVTRSRIQQFIRSRTAPPGVHQRVQSFLEFWWSSHRGAIAGELLNELPEAIKRPVVRSMCQPALRTLSLLAGVRTSLDALEQVFIDNIRFILYGQGEIIYRQGDYASGLFFLLEGELIIIANGGTPRTLVNGGFIGTAALNLSETSVSYAERVTAASGCILIFVSREHLNGIHKAFPSFSMAIRALENRLESAKLARAQQEYSGRERSWSGGQLPTPSLKKLTVEMKLLQHLGLESLVFDPDTRSSAGWELWIFGLTIALYLKVITDIMAGVKDGDVVRSEVIAVLFEIFFAFDFYFHSRLGFYEYGNKSMDVGLIRKRFFRSRHCYCDALALIPLYVVNWMVPLARRHDLLSINKLLRLMRTPTAFAKLEIDADSREFNSKLSSLRLLLGHFHLPLAIEEQLKTYFFFQRYHTITQEHLLERCLPPSLLTEIRLVHLQPMIVKVGFLAGMEGSVTRMLVSQFVQVLTVKDQFVFRLGEEGSDMFFVFTGIIEVLVPLETLQRRQSNDAKLGSLGSPSRSSFRTFFHPLDPSKLQARSQLKKSAFHLQWLKTIAVGTICMALVVPYRNAFDSLERLSPMPITERIVELTCEVLFAWDIWVNWNLKDGLESMELYEHKHRDTYQKERLWIDIIAAIPIDHFLSDFYQSPLLCLNRCLKLFNFPHYMKEINRRSVSYEKNRLCTLWVLLFVLMHWCACVYFALATRKADGDGNVQDWDSWTPPHLVVSWSDPSQELLMLRFLRGIFFSFTAFIKKGKVFVPVNYADYLFTLLVDFIGLVTMAFMISEMANLYISYISNEVEFRKNYIAVGLYLDRWNITGQLRARSHAFLSSLWISHRGVNYQAIFDEIPQVIHTESILHIANLPLRAFINTVFRPFATPHPHDRELEALTHAIAQHLKYEGYPRDEPTSGISSPAA
ncbi:hypothetical protein BBO99_00001806 [Phytophthora kernoviae]|uniref:Cyclic nucleotide-binding domain-containing protein n=1 Tax=Phytophthora kernoviae TaxID=325452 RepID=A0A421F7Y6_9STRA|nr:hypothetical protein BBI17_001577 [Phytophthora kernoviae]RLN83817.1 hypothetical protein BBO99_00001806 [Phytophthora kernoviae]